MVDMEADRYGNRYYRSKIIDTANTFRKLGETYEELQKGNDIISEQFLVLSDALQSCFPENISRIQLSRAKYNEVVRGIYFKGIKIKWLTVINKSEGPEKNKSMQPKGTEVTVVARSIRNSTIKTEKLAQMLSIYFDMEFGSSEYNRNIIAGQYRQYTFIQKPKFMVLSGTAKINKEGCGQSGDNFSLKEFECGQTMATLVDGMGSGEKANYQSTLVIELMEKCIEAGFSEKMTVGLINVLLSQGKVINDPVTIDMSIIDRYCGVINCVKLGAASTFIKREGSVEIIKSTTLPIGVLSQVDYDNKIKKLYNGEYVVMVSDGVLENLKGLNKEKAMVEIINEVLVSNPKAMADIILHKALESNNMKAKDDMTVLVMGVFDTVDKLY